MSSKTYRCRGIVLKKSHFGESDQVITLLLEDGSQLRVVAKGSRKPKNRSSSYLELFNTTDVLCAKGRGLDVATETSLVCARMQLGCDPVLSAAASMVTEILVKSTDVELAHPRLFDMSGAVLDCLGNATESDVAALVCAFIFKLFAMEGLRPVFSKCVFCGCDINFSGVRDVRISVGDGGIVCGDCANMAETVWVNGRAVHLADRLLNARFQDISTMEISDDVQFEMLQLCQMWTNVHIGAKLKSLALFCDLRFLGR